jgi:hypothetical protein
VVLCCTRSCVNGKAQGFPNPPPLLPLAGARSSKTKKPLCQDTAAEKVAKGYPTACHQVSFSAQSSSGLERLFPL